MDVSQLKFIKMLLLIAAFAIAAAIARLVLNGGAGAAYALLGVALIVIVTAYLRLDTFKNLVKSESAVPNKLERDQLTGVYTEEGALYLGDRFLNEDGTEGVHGVLVATIDNLNELRQSHGGDFADMSLMTMAEKVCFIFRKTDIIGRFSDNGFFIFLKHADSKAQLLSQTAALMAELSSVTGDGEALENYFIGGALYKKDGKNLFELRDKAVTALEHAKTLGENSYALYNDKLKMEN